MKEFLMADESYITSKLLVYIPHYLFVNEWCIGKASLTHSPALCLRKSRRK
jgi:hypothetical protein